MNSRCLRLALFAAVAGLFAGCSAESKRLRLLERAEGFQKAGDLERARIEYQNVLQLQPDDLLANEGLATIWYDRGATVRAIAQLSKVVTLAPGNLDARLKRAQLLAALGKGNDAGREALAILGRSSSAAEALVLLTESVRDAADLKGAEEYLQKFSEKDTVSYHIAAANLFSFRGDRVKARAALDRAVVIDPKSAAAHTAMAGLHTAMGKPAEARAEFKLAADLTPVRSRTRVQYAGYLAQTGSLTEAAAMLNDITRQAPDSQLAWRALAQISMAEKRPDDAVRFLEKALALDAADYEALVMRARIGQTQGDLKKVIAEYQRIGTTFPGLGLEKHQLGILLLQTNDVAGATTALEQAVAFYPDNIEATVLLAQLQLRAGEHQRVASSMAALLSRRADLVQPYLLLIDATKALGKLDELVAVFSQNLSANPKNVLLHHMLGLTYGQQKKPVEMRQSLEKALELAPSFAPAMAELGNLDLQEG
ncbi:MAG: tetratricopeptide repeat protein [Opitutaceae bacterium]